jgi:hypothetical protein
MGHGLESFMQETCPPAYDDLVALLRNLDHHRAIDAAGLAQATGLDAPSLAAALAAADDAGIDLVRDADGAVRLAAPLADPG